MTRELEHGVDGESWYSHVPMSGATYWQFSRRPPGTHTRSGRYGVPINVAGDRIHILSVADTEPSSHGHHNAQRNARIAGSLARANINGNNSFYFIDVPRRTSSALSLSGVDPRLSTWRSMPSISPMRTFPPPVDSMTWVFRGVGHSTDARTFTNDSI